MAVRRGGEVTARGPRPTSRARQLRIEHGVVEAQTAFDDLPGGRRNHDLLLFATAGGRPTSIGVEAKADERFGETLDDYLASAARRINPKNAPAGASRPAATHQSASQS